MFETFAPPAGAVTEMLGAVLSVAPPIGVLMSTPISDWLKARL